MQPTQYNSGQKKSGRAVMTLILGILSLVTFGPLTGIPAWIIGNNVLADMKNGTEDPSDMGLAQVGRILGIVTTALFGLGVLIFLGFIAFTGFLATSATRSSGVDFSQPAPSQAD